MTATVISSVGTKGGIGKTSLVKHLGIAKAEQGARVLLIDLCQNSDIATRLGYRREDFIHDSYDWVTGQASLDQVLQFDKETGVDFIPASNQVDKIMEYAAKSRPINQEFILKEKIMEIIEDYDYILIDNHPTETNRMMVMSLVASDIALVPTLMDMSSVVATIRTVEFVRSLVSQGIHLQYYVVPFAVDFSKGFGKELTELKAEFAKLKILNVTDSIRYSAVMMRAGMNGTVMDMNNKYFKQVMDDYRVMAKVF